MAGGVRMIAALMAFLGTIGLLFWKRNADGSLFTNVSTKSETYGPVQYINQTDLDTLARTLWGEARNQGYRGMQAVANVIWNRYKLASRNSNYRRQFGATVAEICRKPYQFSCWLSNDPNLPKLLKVTTSDPVFRQALEIAELQLRGRLPDITGGADHYHTTSITANWSQNKTPISTIGHHEFYKLP